jgi:hypothetical protein
MNVYRTVAKVNSFFRAFPVFRLAFGQTQSIDGNSIFINTMIDQDRRWLLAAPATLPAILWITGKLVGKPNHPG